MSEKIRITLYLTPEELGQVDAVAEREYRTRNNACMVLIQRGLQITPQQAVVPQEIPFPKVVPFSVGEGGNDADQQ